MASEADGTSARASWARKLLCELVSYRRLVMAGLLADLSSMHREWVRQADLDDPQVEEVARADECFRAKLDLWFTKGAVMSSGADKTYTSQVIIFLKKRMTLYFKGQAVTFGIPNGRDALFEPLHRVRAVVSRMLELLPKYAPRKGWAQTFMPFLLPNAFGPSGDTRLDVRKLFRKALMRLAEQVRCDSPTNAVTEFQKLVPFAERQWSKGADRQQAWARAAAAFPELKMARELVTVYLSCLHSTGATERSLKDVALHHSASRTSMSEDTVENSILIAVHGPTVDSVARRETLQDGTSLIVPVGRFLPKVVEAYKAAYGTKACHRARKPHRHIGSRQDLGARKRRRIEAGRPQPEAEFLRDRQDSVRALMRSARQRGMIHSGLLLGFSVSV